jgi:hypothetical protein
MDGFDGIAAGVNLSNKVLVVMDIAAVEGDIPATAAVAFMKRA